MIYGYIIDNEMETMQQYVQSSMLHGSETWPERKENEVALQPSDECVTLMYK